MKQFIRKCAEYFSDYKRLARIMICLSLFVAIVVALGFTAFQLSKGVDDVGNQIVAFGVKYIPAKAESKDSHHYAMQIDANHQIMGMFVFLSFFATLVIAIVIIAQCFKYAFPKGKMNPGKAHPILCVVNAGLCVINAVFCVVAVVYDHSLIPVFWYVVMALFIVAALANAVMLLPVLRSHYYMPKFEEKK